MLLKTVPKCDIISVSAGIAGIKEKLTYFDTKKLLIEKCPTASSVWTACNILIHFCL